MLYIVFDQKHYGINGTIELKRGDVWNLDAQIIDKVKSVKDDFDISAFSCTAFFEGEVADIVVPVNFIVPQAGKINFEVPASSTSVAKIASLGNTMYITIDDGQGVSTVGTIDSPLEVADRGYTQF